MSENAKVGDGPIQKHGLNGGRLRYIRLVQEQITLDTCAHFRSQKSVLLGMGVPHFKVKFHGLGLPV